MKLTGNMMGSMYPELAAWHKAMLLLLLLLLLLLHLHFSRHAEDKQSLQMQHQS
jgi:hypothetical protein